MSRTKEDCYNEATLKNLSDPNGTRMDIIYAAMDVYAKEQVITFINWYFTEAPKMEVENFDEGLLFVDADNDKITKEQLCELYIIQSKTKQ